ncbi:uncharacterized protein G2W53_020358 [Senna tora]|uniref:Uncharacterized protein n=1 Tax=Senna tora TaxID=362788 RepID=A0A834TWG0_9FABA|nr:uncharacterized protein G2W53_020358 [Senna tora]
MRVDRNRSQTLQCLARFPTRALFLLATPMRFHQQKSNLFLSFTPTPRAHAPPGISSLINA